MTEDLILFSPLAKSKADFSQSFQLKPFKTPLFRHNDEFSEMITGRLSSSFHDFGRESLGILPDDLTKQSLGFLNNSLLGSSFNVSNCAINLLPMEEEFLDGRESLGILELNKIFNKDDIKVPNILLTVNESCNESVCDILDTAFLNTSFQKIPSVSSRGSTNISFHSASLEEPSQIYTVTPNCEAPGISSSSGSILSVLNKGFISPKQECRRIQSLPEPSKNKSETDPDSVKNSENVHYATFNGNANDSDDDKFHDSVFIEGKYIAHTIADGSILSDSFNNEMGNLDNIPAPSWDEFAEPEQTNDIENSPIKTNIKTDILIKDSTPIPEIPSTTNSVKTNRSILNKSHDAREILQNLSEILNTTGHSDQQISEGQHLLSSLAELLGERSTKSINLEDSGHSSSVNELNSDLSHGSYNKTDLSSLNFKRKTLSMSNNSNNRLSLSLNSASTKPKIYKKPNISNVDLSKNKDISKNSSTKSDGTCNGSLGLSSVSIKLRNKSTDKTSKKGPVKAVIPINNMKKKEIKWETPERTNSSIKKSSQYKKTSTPLNKPKLVPVAASTPTYRQTENVSPAVNSSKSLRNLSGPQNKSQVVYNNRRSLPSPNSFTHQPEEHKKLNQSLTSASSKEKIANPAPTLRKSFNHVDHKEMQRKPLAESRLTKIEGRPRSNSLGSAHPTGLMSSMNKIRENLLNSPEYKKITKSVLKESNKSVSKLTLGDDRRTSLPKLKKTGKENLRK